MEAAAEVEEIDLLGAARRVGGPGQRPAVGQRVDQAGLADIRPAGESDLRQGVRRQIAHAHDARNEGAFLREQQAPGFEFARFGIATVKIARFGIVGFKIVRF